MNQLPDFFYGVVQQLPISAKVDITKVEED